MCKRPPRFAEKEGHGSVCVEHWLMGPCVRGWACAPLRACRRLSVLLTPWPLVLCCALCVQRRSFIDPLYWSAVAVLQQQAGRRSERGRDRRTHPPPPPAFLPLVGRCCLVRPIGLRWNECLGRTPVACSAPSPSHPRAQRPRASRQPSSSSSSGSSARRQYGVAS